jgi:hypothetical protein
MSNVAVLRCGTGQTEGPTRKGQGLWPAGTLVGVTGYEPAAFSSRSLVRDQICAWSFCLTCLLAPIGSV